MNKEDIVDQVMKERYLKKKYYFGEFTKFKHFKKNKSGLYIAV